MVVRLHAELLSSIHSCRAIRSPDRKVPRTVVPENCRDSGPSAVVSLFFKGVVNIV